MRRQYSACFLLCLSAAVGAQQSTRVPDAAAPYRQSKLPIEDRVRDLIKRMTIEEKARQLDMYAGVPDLVDNALDKTHAAANANSEPQDAERLFGKLGVGSIHDLYPER